MRVIYMYHQSDPEHGSVAAGSLPNPQAAYKGYIPLSLTQRLHDESRSSANMDYGNKAPVVPSVYTMELRNQDVTLPQVDDTQFWCKVFEVQQFRQKQHLIKVLNLRHRCVQIPNLIFIELLWHIVRTSI